MRRVVAKFALVLAVLVYGDDGRGAFAREGRNGTVQNLLDVGRQLKGKDPSLRADRHHDTRQERKSG